MKTFNIRNLRPGSFRYVPKNDRPSLRFESLPKGLGRPIRSFMQNYPSVQAGLHVRSGNYHLIRFG
jgi:hypothetical protein